MNYLWNITLDHYLEIARLAQEHGKKAGDSMKEEFLEFTKKKNIKPFAKTEMDADMIAGNLREEGMKVLNTKELYKKKDV